MGKEKKIFEFLFDNYFIMFWKKSLKIYCLYEDVILPKFETLDSACFDIRCYFNLGDKIVTYDEYNQKNIILVSDFLSLKPNHRILLPTGLILDIPKGYSVRLHPRSGLSLKNGITLSNCEGVIDSDFVDPLYIILYNSSKYTFKIKSGDRICQGEMIKKLPLKIKKIKKRPLQKTNRSGGFGSTGNN